MAGCEATTKYGWCGGPSGRKQCLECSQAAETSDSSVSGIVSSKSPVVSVDLASKSIPPKPVVPLKPSQRLVRSGSLAKSARQLEIEALCAPKIPDSFAGKFAYRGVGSSPLVYQERGGFKPWQIPTMPEARDQLRHHAKSLDLGAVAWKWQASKDKMDGYFTSTGTSAFDSYDNYDFSFRIDLGNLVLRNWNTMLADVKPESVDKCYLYTDAADLEGSKLIAIICTRGGNNRAKELLIMSPVPIDKLEVKHNSQYMSCPDWIDRFHSD